MKVLLVSRRYFPEVIGGGQISAHQIAIALKQAGHDVHVLTFVTNAQRKDEVLDGIPIARVPIRTLRWFPRLSNLEWMYCEMARVLREHLKEFRPDVIHALNGESVPSVAKIAKKEGIPWVATINGPTLFCFTQEGTDSRGQNCIGCKGKQRFRETMLKWGAGSVLNKLKAFTFWLYSYPHMAVFDRALRKANQLLPVSNGFRRRLIEIGYPAEKLMVVHNPIATHAKQKTSLKKELGIKPAEHLLFFAGRITENKGIQHMIACLPALPSAHVVLAGKGDAIGSLQQQANQLGVASRVHFAGVIPNEKIGAYYSIANVVIMAGTFYEALGRMLIEACSYGVPVIATNTAGSPDIIEHGKNGYLLDCPEQLAGFVKDVLEHPAKEKKLGAYGKVKMEKEFSHAKVAKDLVAVYEEIISF